MRKRKPPPPKRAKPNPLARALRQPLFRLRRVEGPDAYRRRAKHRRPPGEDGD